MYINIKTGSDFKLLDREWVFCTTPCLDMLDTCANLFHTACIRKIQLAQERKHAYRYIDTETAHPNLTYEIELWFFHTTSYKCLDMQKHLCI